MIFIEHIIFNDTILNILFLTSIKMLGGKLAAFKKPERKASVKWLGLTTLVLLEIFGKGL